MKKFLPIIIAKLWLIILLFSLLLFFHPVFLKGYIPFPGELLVGGYVPWKAYSYLGYAPGGVPNKAQGIDVLKQLYPWKFFAVDQFKKGQWPLWNPYNFAGNPAAANFQTGAFYPLNIVFLLPFNLGWTIFIILQPLLAFIFMYLFLRNLKLSQLSSSLGGLSFAFSLYMAVWMEYGNVGHTLLWLPLLLLLVDKLKEKFCLKYLFIFTITLSFSILAGYIQQVIYALVVVSAYFLLRHLERKNLRKFLVKGVCFSLAIAVTFLLCSLQLFPTWEIFQQSARNIYNAQTIKNLLLPWFYLITVAIPDFFGNPANRNYWLTGTYIERVSYLGIVPLIFALSKIFSHRDKTTWFFLIMAGVVLLLTINLWPAQFFFSLQIPVLGTTVPTRIMAQFSFALAVLAAFGLEDYWKNKEKLPKKIFLIPLVFVALGFWLFLLPKDSFFPGISAYITTKRNVLISTLILFVVISLLLFGKKYLKKEVVIITLLFLTAIDLFFFFQRITPFAPSAFVYPRTEIFAFLQENQGIWRFWGYGEAYSEENFASQEKLYSPEGVDPLFINRYGELISTSSNGKIKSPLPRADVLIAPGYGTSDLRLNQYRQKILNLLGVRFVLHRNADTKPDILTFPENSYSLFVQRGDWQVYENKEVVPRIFLTSDYVVLKDKNEIFNKIFNENFPSASKLILEEQPEIKLGKNGIEGARLKLVSYDANRVSIETVTSEPKLLFLSDNYFPGWKARVDNKLTKIYRTDYTFRSVVVPQGKHLVEFTYEPESFYKGLKISLITMIMLLLGISVSVFVKRYDKPLV